MATLSKRIPKPAVKQPASSRPKARATSKPYLRFYHSDGLRAKTIAVLTTVERSPDPEKHRDALADIVVNLTNAGMDYYFMRSLKSAKVGFIIQQSANIGMAATLQVFGTVIRNVIGRMDRPQLLSVCGSIREFMR